MSKKSYSLIIAALFLTAMPVFADFEDFKYNTGSKIQDFKDSFADFKDGIQLNIKNPFEPDMRKKEAKYKHEVEKQDAKEEYERKRQEINPSGFMTLEDYEQRSKAVDHSQDEIEIPKPEKPSDMKYVPQYTYKIVLFVFQKA